MIGSVWAIVWGEIFLRRHLHGRYIKLALAENHPPVRLPRRTGKISGPSNAVRSSLLPAATACLNCSTRFRPCFMFNYLTNMHCDLKSLAWRYCSIPRGILNGLCAHLKRSGRCSRYSVILTPHHRLPLGRTTCVFLMLSYGV
jgi:hypothetical protein